MTANLAARVSRAQTGRSRDGDGHEAPQAGKRRALLDAVPRWYNGYPHLGWIHRGPMHRSTAGMRIIYQRHTREHHALYPAHAMHVGSHRELAHVLFPVWFLPFILVVNLPIPLLLAWIGSPNLAWLFSASALAYYLVYEWFHLLHHLPDTSLLTRNCVTRWLRPTTPGTTTNGS